MSHSVKYLQESEKPVLWPPPPEEPRIKFLYSISKPQDIGYEKGFFEKVLGVFAGSQGQRQMVRPHGLYFSKDEVLYVTDPGLHMVHVFDLKAHKYNQIKKHEKKEFLSPIGVDMDSRGNLYVSDSMLKRIFVFGPNGKSSVEIGKEENLLRPTGIAVQPELKRLYVVDTVAHMIKVFSLSGEYLFNIGGRGIEEGKFNYPTSLVIDKKGRLYVNDSLNYRIQVFESDGSFLYSFGKHGDGLGEFSQPKGIALDSEDHLYVADAIFDSIQVFDPSGALLLSFCDAGHGPLNLWLPSSIYIDKFNRIFVSDSYNQRVQVYKFLGENGS
jgi:sugar lactone lactonase YvrE